MLNDDPRQPVYANEIQCQIEAIAANLKPIASLTTQTFPLSDSNAVKNVKTQVFSSYSCVNYIVLITTKIFNVKLS